MISRIELTLKSNNPAKPLELAGKTGAGVEFTFADVPLGSYTIVSKKRIKRSSAEKETPVTVDGKTEPVVVSIVLSMFDKVEKKEDE